MTNFQQESMGRSAAAELWLAEKFGESLAEVLGAIAGPGAVGVECRPARARAEPEHALPGEKLCWEQPFQVGPGAVLRVSADRRAWMQIGGAALEAAGIPDGRAEEVRRACLDTLTEAIARLARAIGSRSGRETPGGVGAEIPEHAFEDARFEALVTLDEGRAATLALDFSPALLQALAGDADAAREPHPERANSADGSGNNAAPAPAGRSIDLLLDVELPVSVSFGRTSLPLKDVVKLTTGSIVELNRSVAEPVEVIVNNCVIARGEVVVVDGNYGVKIHEIVSRQDRLRSLY